MCLDTFKMIYCNLRSIEYKVYDTIYEIGNNNFDIFCYFQDISKCQVLLFQTEYCVLVDLLANLTFFILCTNDKTT